MPHEPVEQIYLLTLALEAALNEENWSEADALFHARDCALQEAEQRPSNSLEWIDKTQEVEARIAKLLNSRRTHLQSEMREGATSLRAHQTYRKKSLQTGYESFG